MRGSGESGPMCPDSGQSEDHIDARRACRILGVSYTTLSRMGAKGLIHWAAPERSTWKQVHYLGLVSFCDRIREEHRIPDRRPQLPGPLRHRDEDLLPFPLTDTIGSAEACTALGCRKLDSLMLLISRGRIEAYHLASRTPWRVSRPSLQRYLVAREGPLPGYRPYQILTT